MSEILRHILRFFGFSPKPKILPKPGERWEVKPEDGCPWPTKHYSPALILEVKDGWVRYKLRSDVFPDERMKLSSFLYLFRKTATNET